MLKITTHGLLAYAKRLEGHMLQTLHNGKKFVVSFDEDTLVFIPASTYKARPYERKYLKQVCRRFNKRNSLNSDDYRDRTRNASYGLTLIAKYLGAVADGAVERTNREQERCEV